MQSCQWLISSNLDAELLSSNLDVNSLVSESMQALSSKKDDHDIFIKLVCMLNPKG